MKFSKIEKTYGVKKGLLNNDVAWFIWIESENNDFFVSHKKPTNKKIMDLLEEFYGYEKSDFNSINWEEKANEK